MPSNPLMDLDDEASWKALTSSQNTAICEKGQDSTGTSSFSKSVHEEDWYMAATLGTSLMELPPYSPSPYGISDTRSSYNLLDSSLNFDNSHTLLNSYRTAPLTLGMDGGSRILDEMTRSGGQGSGGGLLSSISSGGHQNGGPYGSSAGRSLPMGVSMDSFSTGLPTNFQLIPCGSLNTNNSLSTKFPHAFSDTFATPALSQGEPGSERSGALRNEVMSCRPNKRPESSLQGPQTLYQKRAASRHTSGGGTSSPSAKSPPRVFTSASNDSSVDMPDKDSPNFQNGKAQNAVIRKPDHNSGSDDLNDMGLDGDDDDGKDDDDELDESGDGSGGPYEVEEGAGNGLDNHTKGKGKKGLPAKNLMAERRRRKKLNDRLYMLRSVVPKITKMDRASILGDAIEYVKELLQRINDLHNDLESAKLERSRSLPTSPTGPLIPMSTQGGYPIVKEECPVLPNPESQPPRVEVRKRDGQSLNIHMFCARRPGLLLSTVRALDALGLDVQQAVISCFNGFALDLFRAEQASDMEVGAEDIKSVLLLTAGCNMHLQ